MPNHFWSIDGCRLVDGCGGGEWLGNNHILAKKKKIINDDYVGELFIHVDLMTTADILSARTLFGRGRK